MKIKCPACDFENENGARFCENCNEPLYKRDYSEDNPYIKKRGTDFDIITILSILFVAAVLFLEHSVNLLFLLRTYIPFGGGSSLFFWYCQEY